MTKKLAILLSCIVFMLMIFPMVTSAEDNLPSEYSNQLDIYAPETYGTCRTSFMGVLANGGYQTAIYDDGIIYVRNYDEEYQLTWSKEVELELPIWGGLLLGEEYNYVVCGDYYYNQETYRVIQYDKKFNRINSTSFYYGETYTKIPFDASNVSMDENGKVLTVYTGRTRVDGHQSNIVLRINTKDMTVYDSDGMGEFADVHVSHSFRQIVKYDGEDPVYVDLSDALPERGVYLQSKNKGVLMWEIPGEPGYNVTNADVSGLEISDTHYLVTGTYLNGKSYNIFLSCANKDTGEVIGHWLTDSTIFSVKYAADSRIVKIAKDRFIVMWNALNSVNYVIADGEGNIVGEVKEKATIGITDCEPIFHNGKVIWMSVKDGETSFMEITDFAEDGEFKIDYNIVEAVNPWDGTADVSWYSDSEDTFTLTTPQQLAGLAELVNAGNTFVGKKVKLGNDIFLNGDEIYSYEWTPISYWEGTFSGEGHHIYNMYVSGDSDGGLFGIIGENGIVKAVNISQGLLYAGGCIADQNEGIIAMCSSYSSVGSNNVESVGGICNENYNLVYGCRNYGEVWGGSPGGIVGYNWDTLAVVSQCSNHGWVGGTHLVGGVVNWSVGWIYNCYNCGIVSNSYAGNINKGREMGGIVEYNHNTVANCYMAGSFVNDSGIGRPSAISFEGVRSENCYTLPLEGHEGTSMEEMKSEAFLEQLDQQKYALLSAWVMDTEMINDGLPITVADANYAKGIYKVQPEVWMPYDNGGDITLDVADGEYYINVSFYYNEKSPVVTVGDSRIAEVLQGEYSSGKKYIKVIPKRAGSTYINIHFEETENNISDDYQVKLIITGGESVDSVPDTNEQVTDFVERMYTVALGRAAESEGATWWTNELLNGTSDGAGLAQGFLTGEEFFNKGYSNAEYVAVLYDTFFDREIAEGEGDFWVSALDSGTSRESVLSGFVNSKEFFNLCTEYGILRGVMLESGIAVNAGIGKFAERLYTEVLERDGEEDGMEYWAVSIANGECTPEDAAKNFFTSTEYLSKNSSDVEYVKALYRTFMGRECDEAGLNYWVNALSAEVTREKVLNDFAVSEEFKVIMAGYGL